MMTMTYEMPKLPYANNALEPVISQQTIDFHYGKHLQTYVNNLNSLVPGTEYECMINMAIRLTEILIMNMIIQGNGSAVQIAEIPKRWNGYSIFINKSEDTANLLPNASVIIV